MEENKYFENIATYKLMAKHEVGQNFLIDKDVAKKIVDLAEINDDDNVLEIGCGAGSLSFYIAQYDAKATLIDIDEAMITKTKKDFDDKANVVVEKGNAMKFDYAGYTKIISNLPYYITSGIIKNILVGAQDCTKAVLMVQSEACDRLFAKVGTSDYSPLSILLEYRVTKTSSFRVSRNCFVPSPHIDSTVFCVDFKPESDVKTAKGLFELTSKLFASRRKTIENNLSKVVGGKDKADEILTTLGINPKTRPEQIEMNTYLRMYALLNN